VIAVAPELESPYPERIAYGQLCGLEELKLYRFFNTREDWYDFGLRPEGRRLLFETELAGDAAQVANDVFNLQYFFVRIEPHLRENRANRPDYLLLIHIPDENDLRRAATYLSMQAKYFPDLYIYITDVPLEKTAPDTMCRRLAVTSEYLRLLPLLRVHEEGLPYAALEDPRGGLSSGEVREICRGLSEKLREKEEKRAPAGAAAEPADGEEEAEEAAEEPPAETDDPGEEPAITVREREAVSREERELLTICGEMIRKFFKQLKGTRGRPMTAGEKAAVVETLGAYFEKRFDQINLMTQLLWLLCLYTLNQEKRVSFAQTERSSPEELYLPELEKSFAYAKSFADGILQIVENSCMHTDAKSAYLSIRLHHVDLSARESDLMEVLNARSRLTKRYTRYTSGSGKESVEAVPKARMKLLEKIPYYLEINVVDDASYMDPETNKRRLRGITEVFLANYGSLVPVETLLDVFRYYPVLRGEERSPSRSGEKEEQETRILDQITWHYGLHVIQKMVMTNQGICAVRTPSMDLEEPANMKNDRSEYYTLFPESGVSKVQKQATASASGDRFIRSRGMQYRRCRGRTRGTEYQLLLPMSSRIMAGAYEENPRVPAPVELLDTEVLRWKSPVEQTTIDLEALFSQLQPGERDGMALFDAGVKRKQAAEFETRLREEFQRRGARWDAGGYRIYLLNVGQIRGVRLELAAKGLFRYIARVEQRRDQLPSGRKRMLLALYFSDETQMQSFLQMYSIFYSADGRNDFMEGVQLALCQTAPETGLPEISTVLMGRDIDSARRTAEVFVYYHSESSLQVLPFLSYLTRSEADSAKSGSKRESEEPSAIFPFDLYLKEFPGGAPAGQEPEDGPRVSPELDCWFLRKMIQITQRELRKRGYGCKIPDVHVRLGSKMHIEVFFEAELLFQNIGNIARFAFLAVRQYCSGYYAPDKPVFLVAYEDYSSILVQYVKKYLSSVLGRPEAVDYAIFTNQPEKRLCLSAHFENLPLSEKLAFLNEAEVVTLLPVGTTLSTIYRMRDSVAELAGRLGDRAEAAGMPSAPRYKPAAGDKNMVIVLVADSRQESLVKQYWSRDRERVGPPRGRGWETIDMTSPDGGDNARARYFIQVHADWHNHLDCIDDDGRSRVLVYVDTTSTVPNMVFPLLDDLPQGVSAFEQTREEFTDRFNCLEGCITYGHIKNGANHFLYDIDLAKFCIQAEAPAGRGQKSHKTVSRWLDELREKNDFVEPGAFNIIVSPLDMENAPFLQLAAEHLFSHSIRFLRIPIMDSRTDDIRAKFSFIAQECREIRRKNIPINVYYVDNSIVTGNTFQRGRKLIQLLLRDGEDSRTGTGVFRGILLLLNRSRLDTASSMVDMPEKYYQAYLHLAVPHYNTIHGTCPGCRFYQRNQRIAESCSTNFLADEFCRLSEKYRLYSREEYEATQREALYNSGSAFRQLCQWLYEAPARKKKEADIGRAYEIACEIRRWTLRSFLEERGVDWSQGELTALAARLKEEGPEFGEAYLRAAASAGLRVYLEKGPGKKSDAACLEAVWLHHVLNERAMLRACCTHQAYDLLEGKEILEDGKISPGKIKECLYGLMRGEEGLPPRLSHVCLDEQRISYLKILSREYLAKYYDIREQIADQMVGLLYALLELKSAEQDRGALAPSAEGDKSYPLLRYQLLLTLYQQLANLQVNVILKRDILSAAKDKIASLRREYFDCLGTDEAQFLLCPMVPDNDQHVQFAKCVKWQSLSNDEENNCFLIQRELPLPRECR